MLLMCKEFLRDRVQEPTAVTFEVIGNGGGECVLTLTLYSLVLLQLGAKKHLSVSARRNLNATSASSDSDTVSPLNHHPICENSRDINLKDDICY